MESLPTLVRRPAPRSSSMGCADSSTAATTRPGSRVHDGKRSRDRARRGQAREPRRGAREAPAPRDDRHRPHALGDARAPERGQRAPARRGRHRRRPQRHHREPRRPAARARGARASSFSSDTDTEIVAHLIDLALHARALESRRGRARGAPPRRGAYAIAVVARAPGRLCRREGTPRPLVLGIGEGEMLCGSDIPALLAHTRDVIFLEDGDMAVAQAQRARASRPSPASRSTRVRSASTGRRRRPRRAATSTSCSRRSTSSRAPSRTRCAAASIRRAATSCRRDRRHRRARRRDQPRLLRRLRHELSRGDGRSLLGRAARPRSPRGRD